MSSCASRGRPRRLTTCAASDVFPPLRLAPDQAADKSPGHDPDPSRGAAAEQWSVVRLFDGRWLVRLPRCTDAVRFAHWERQLRHHHQPDWIHARPGAAGDAHELEQPALQGVPHSSGAGLARHAEHERDRFVLRAAIGCADSIGLQRYRWSRHPLEHAGEAIGRADVDSTRERHRADHVSCDRGRLDHGVVRPAEPDHVHHQPRAQ